MSNPKAIVSGKADSNSVYLVEQDNLISGTPTIESLRDKPILRLTATTVFSKTETATVSNFPVSSNQNQGDHYRNNGADIKITGVIAKDTFGGTDLFSDSSFLSDSTVISYLTSVKSLVRMRTSNNKDFKNPLVTVYLPDDNLEGNCLITSFDISRDSSVGDGYKVSLSLKKLLVADKGNLLVTTLDDSYKETSVALDTEGQAFEDPNHTAKDLGLNEAVGG